MTDTHSHPYYLEDAEGFIRRAIDAGVTRIIMPNVDIASIEPMKALARLFPQNVRMAMGLHPTLVSGRDIPRCIVDELAANSDQYVAVGEIGVDLYWDKSMREQQMYVFDRQLAIAEDAGLPVIIHCREALDETLEVLSGHKGARGVFHSFGGDRLDVERILKDTDGRFYFGINGIVTFKNSGLRDVIPAIPRDRLLLETDSPYLAPVPYRGKQNESSYLPVIAATVADALGTSIEVIDRQTTENSVALFGF